MRTTSFATSPHRSPLSEIQSLGQIGKSSSKKKGHGNVLLPLTSLIDAFSIIVIYLLIGTQSGGLETDLPTQIKLPAASNSDIVDAEMPTVRIEKGVYYIDDKKVAVSDLAMKLSQLKSKTDAKDGMEIIIQADKTMNYEELDPLLRAGSAAGIQKLKFAVIPNK